MALMEFNVEFVNLFEDRDRDRFFLLSFLLRSFYGLLFSLLFELLGALRLLFVCTDGPFLWMDG